MTRTLENQNLKKLMKMNKYMSDFLVSEALDVVSVQPL